MRPLSSKDTARMASEEVEAEKNSLKLTGASLNGSDVAKSDNENAETAEVTKEGRNELPIRETTKESKITPEERKAENGVDVAEVQKEAVAMSLKNGVFEHGFEDHNFIPLILPNSVPEDETTAAIETVRVMKLKHVDLIDAKLWQRWAEVQGVLKYTGNKSEELFEDYIKKTGVLPDHSCRPNRNPED